MKLSNKQMDIYVHALEKISDKVTGKLAFAVAKNLRKLSNELVEYQNMNNKTIAKYGTPDEQGRYSIRIDSEEYMKYYEDMKEIQDMGSDVDIQMVNPETIENSNLNAQEILTIDFMITEETDG